VTCIVGLKSRGRVLIGGDSAGVGGLDLQVRADQKVWARDGFAFGFTTSFRMGQLLQYSLALPKRHPDVDLMKWMVTDFVDAVRTCLKTGGFAAKQNEEERGGTFLVGHAGRLFRIDADYQVGEMFAEYDSCGCGESYAKGALYATTTAADLDPDARVLIALNAAQQMSAGVRGPFTVVSVGEEKS
jgi:ATP-dependent protease HslVU (ClpYQ) peptidase subunit